MNGGSGEKKPDAQLGRELETTLPGTTAKTGKQVATFMVLLGLGWRGTKQEEGGAGVTDVGTRLAHERTDLAENRSYLASERTLMAWIRTALSMISFGFTLGKIGEALQEVEFKGAFRVPHTVSVESLAYFLVILGTFALAVATLQHLLRTHELVKMGFRPQFSTAVAVAVLLFMVGGFAFTALVMNL